MGVRWEAAFSLYLHEEGRSHCGQGRQPCKLRSTKNLPADNEPIETGLLKESREKTAPAGVPLLIAIQV